MKVEKPEGQSIVNQTEPVNQSIQEAEDKSIVQFSLVNLDDPSQFNKVVDFNTEKVKYKRRSGKEATKLKKLQKQQNNQWSDNSSNSEFGNLIKGIDNDFQDIKIKPQSIGIQKPLKVKSHARKCGPERTIKEVMEKVMKWRKMYNGRDVFNPKTGKTDFQQWDLEEAATYLEISKGTLDDYALQIRDGKKYGFNFEANKNCKIGVLRTFVKENKVAKN